MWDNAEVVALLDRQWYVRVVSRNEEEAPIKNVLGTRATNRIHEDSVKEIEEALQAVLAGEEREVMVASYADEGYVFWSRVKLLPSHLEDTPILVHLRRLPRSWTLLSTREQEVIHALHRSGLNPKRAARILGISGHTLNAHRRSICQKCRLDGVGDFWVFVERCR